MLLAAWTLLAGSSGPGADQLATLLRAGTHVSDAQQVAGGDRQETRGSILTSTGMPRQALLKPLAPLVLGGLFERRSEGGVWVLPPEIGADPDHLTWSVHARGVVPDRACEREALARVARGPPVLCRG